MKRRQRMTDFQRIVIYFSVMVAVFLAAMGLGWRNTWLLLSAAVVLVVAVLGVALAVARRGAGRHELATAVVLSVSDPPPNTGIAAKCDMTLEVRLPNRPSVRTRHRDPAVPLTRWPQPGQTFPVDVYGGNPRRRMHIRWDLVEQGIARAPDGGGSTAGTASQAPMWEEEQEPVVYSPTPPRPRRPSATPPPASPSPSPSASPSAPPSPSPSPSPSMPSAPAAAAPAASPPSSVEPPLTGVFLHETFTDLDEETPLTPPSPPRPDPGRPAPHDLRPGPGESNGHDPDGYDPADFETPRLQAAQPPPAVTGGPGFEPVSLTDFDPARVDIRDFTGEPPAVTPMSPDDDAPPAIPSPRDPEDADRGSEADRSSEEVSATLPVGDLAQSLRFYRDALGFSVVVASTESALVENEGTRLRLEQTLDVGAARGEVHLDVTDIEMTCAIARELSGEVVESPAATHGVAGRQLWRARLRDPDGHTIEVVEWRSIEDRY